MKIALFSDIHLEHRNNGPDWTSVIDRVLDTAQGADLVVNAGDTHDDPQVRRWVESSFTSNGFQYLDVLGNHDHYGHEWVSSDFHVTQFGDLKVVHGTMWTNFNGNDDEALEAARWISDFRWIRNVSPEKMVSEFYMFQDFVELTKPDLVVSHFAPSPGSIVDQWKGHSLNSYFCPDMLDKLRHAPKLWLHGHIHNPVSYEARVGDGFTHVVANPLGYPRETYKNIQDYSCTIIEV